MAVGRAEHQKTNRRPVRWGHLFLYVGLTAGAALILLPFVYMVSTSFKSTGEVFKTPIQWLPSELRWDNYKTPLREHPIGHYFKNSLFVGVSVTLLNLLTCSLAGYSFAKFRYLGRDLMFGVVLATMMVPLASMIIPLFMVVKSLGWVDSYLGLIIPAGTSAFGIFLMRQHMVSIPDDLLDAARLDGSSEPRIFLGIVLPMSRTALSSLAIFIFMWNWDSFFWPLLVTTDEQYRTLPLGIALFESSYGTNYPQLMAVAFLAMLPVLIVFLVLQRNFIEALTMSGVKG
jgi:multiple sugar transport system permease protein